MRIPPLHEAQAHLAAAGWQLLPREPEVCEVENLELLDKDGDIIQTFPCLLTFWVYWIQFAARILTQHRRVEVVVKSYARASKKRRETLLYDLENYLDRTDRSGIENLLERADVVSPLALPRNWKSELMRILNGPRPNPWFSTTVIDALIELDPKLDERWADRGQLYPVLAAMRAKIAESKSSETTRRDECSGSERSPQLPRATDGRHLAYGSADGAQESSSASG